MTDPSRPGIATHSDDLTIVRATDFSLTELAYRHAAGFAGYATPVQMDAAALAERIRSEHIDLNASFALHHEGRPVALTLVARRGQSARVASMGVPPEARRQGWGRHAIQTAITEARERGDSLQLEVLTDNTGAVDLYRAAGFQISRTLVGFQGPLETLRTIEPVALHEIPLAQVAAQVAVHAPGLPWQLDAASLHGLGTGWRAWTNGPCYAITKQRDDTLVLLSVLTLPTARRQGHASRLLAAIAQASRGANRAQIISIVPQGSAEEFMSACGLGESPLRQYEMRL